MYLQQNPAAIFRESQKEFPHPTQSLCPECRQVLDAELYVNLNQVWMDKTCPSHGRYNELISTDVDFFCQKTAHSF